MKNRKGFFFTLLIFMFFFLVIISVVTFIRTQQIEEKTAAEKIRADSLKSLSESVKIGAEKIAYTSAYNALRTATAYVATNANKKFLDNLNCSFNSCVFELMLNASLEQRTNYVNFNSETIWFNASDQMGNTSIDYWVKQLKATAARVDMTINFSISDATVYQTDPWNAKISYLLYMTINDTRKESLNRFEIIPINIAIPIEGLEEPGYSLNTTGAVKRYIRKYPYSDYKLASLIAFYKSGSASNWTFGKTNKAPIITPTCSEISSLSRNTILLVKNSSQITNSTFFCQAINSFKGFIFEDNYCYMNNTCRNSFLPFAYNFTTPIYDLLQNRTYILLSSDKKEIWNVSKLLEAYSTGYFFETNFAPTYLMRLSGNYNGSLYGIESFAENFIPTGQISNIDYLYFNKTQVAYRCKIRGVKNCENYTVCSEAGLSHFWIDNYLANKSTDRYPKNHTEIYGLGYEGLTMSDGASCITFPSPYIWADRKTITIDNTQNPNTLTDYQIQITLDTSALISQERMRSDCRDIRFTNSSSYNETDWDITYPYWIESNTCNSPNTKIWIKVDQIPAGSTKTIYLYYENSYASSMNNGDNTFIFFDDFSGGSLDINKWINVEHIAGNDWSTESSANYGFENDRLHVNYSGYDADRDCETNGPAYNGWRFYSKMLSQPSSSNMRIEAVTSFSNVHVSAGGLGELVGVYFNESGRFWGLAPYVTLYNPLILMYLGGPPSYASIPNLYDYYSSGIENFAYTFNTSYYLLNMSGSYNYPDYPYIISGVNSIAPNGQIVLSTSAGACCETAGACWEIYYDVYYDTVMVRKYSSLEPTVTIS